MADQNEEVLQTSQDTPPAEESNSRVDDGIIEESNQEQSEEQTKHSSENPEGNQEDHEEQKKPTRAEKRVGQLLAKLREANVDSVLEKAPSKEIAKTPIITPEEKAEGALDPEVFADRVEKLVQARVEETLAQVEKSKQIDQLNNEYKSAVVEHQTDLESMVDKIPPHLEKLAIKQYEVLNSSINPLTGKKEFIPAVKMSEIVQQLEKDLESVIEFDSQSSRKYSEEISQNQAVPTSSSLKNSRKADPNTEDFSEFEKGFASKA